MSDNKGVRLAKVALEINVGIETIAEHLKKRGFEVDPRPTTKLTDEMYAILLKDFRAEKNLKEKAEQINLRPPKKEDKKEEEQEVVLTKSPIFVKEPIPVSKDPVPFSKEPILPIAEKIAVDEEVVLKVEPPLPIVKTETKIPIVKTETKIPIIKTETNIPDAEPITLPVLPIVKTEEPKVQEKVVEESPRVEIVAPTIDNEQHSKAKEEEVKTPDKEVKTVNKEEKEPVVLAVAPPAQEQTVIKATKANVDDDDDDDDDDDTDSSNSTNLIETNKPILPGTKVVGKIDLDKLSQEAMDKAIAAKKEKRKRKREREKAKKEREKAERATLAPAVTNAVTPPTTEKTIKTEKSDKGEKTEKTERPEKVEKTRSDVRTSQIINEDKPAISVEPEREISKIEAPKLGGLKILGKIDIAPIEEEEKDDKKRKKKRKRIVKDKRVAIEDVAKTASVDGKGGRRERGDAKEGHKEGHKEGNRDGNKDGNKSSGGDKKAPAGNKTPQRDQANRGATGGHKPSGSGSGSGGSGSGGGDANKNKDKKDQTPFKKRTDQRPDTKPVVTPPPQQAVISEKQIQDQMRATMARMAGGTKGKSDRSKNRKLKREQHADRRAEEVTDGKLLQVTEFISVSELAKMMDISATEIITTCFSLGMMVTINYRLDAELIEIVASEFGFQIEFVSATEQDEADAETPDLPEDLVPRPPIVTIMGHVDHGKTSLLDYIRNANVVAGEVGGITQHIGAYSVELADGREITFLDTPGHEAFTAMRARGAKVTDIAIIVIAADDSIMQQTKEAISHAQAANVPMVFAINKIDKPGANPERVKEQLAQMNILVEDWGGSYQSQEISAKKGLNIDLLLEKILLQAELLELKANPNKRGVGTIIEASLDKGKGYVSTVLVQTGTMRVGDPILAGQYYGKVKAMFNERGTKIKSAGPSESVLVLGLNGAPQAGDKARITENEQDARTIALKREQLIREQQQRTNKHITLEEIGRRLALGNFKELNLIIKGDFDGSVEAISDSLLKLSTEEVQVRIIHRSVGAITEGDVLLASASDAIIIGFQVRPTPKARKQAEQENIDIRLYSIIYNAIEEVKQAMEGLLEPTIEEKFVCNVEVRDVFKITKVGTVAGCYVQEGKVFRDTKVRLVRDGVVMYTGSIDSLKRFKDDMKEVQHGMECGISLKNFSDIKEGDMIEGYEEIEIKRKL